MSLEVDIRKKMRDFDLQVSFSEQRKRIGILGASGCGKSMTLKSIAGIETPDTGKICAEGRVLYDSARKINLRPQKRNIGYLFQSYALFPTMTVAENIAAGLSGTREEKRRRVREMAERFHLAGLEDHYPSGLSGGQQQRTALARLMACRPEMILLDEPFSAMDAYLKDQLQEQLSEMLEGYTGTVVLVSHNRDEIYRFCDDVLVMEQGQVIRAGEKKAVFAEPRIRQAAVLTGCKNFCSLERRDAHQAFLRDWGIELFTEREIPEETACIGYRAHWFIPVWAREHPEYDGEIPPNSFRVQERRRVKLPFEMNFYLVPQGSRQPENPAYISWFAQENIQKLLEKKGMPDFLQLDEKQILFLK